jgi:hypothetical protein
LESLVDVLCRQHSKQSVAGGLKDRLAQCDSM